MGQGVVSSGNSVNYFPKDSQEQSHDAHHEEEKEIEKNKIRKSHFDYSISFRKRRSFSSLFFVFWIFCLCFLVFMMSWLMFEQYVQPRIDDAGGVPNFLISNLLSFYAVHRMPVLFHSPSKMNQKNTDSYQTKEQLRIQEQSPIFLGNKTRNYSKSFLYIHTPRKIKTQKNILFFSTLNHSRFPDFPWTLKIFLKYYPKKVVFFLTNYHFKNFTLLDSFLRYQSKIPKKNQIQRQNHPHYQLFLSSADVHHTTDLCQREEMLKELMAIYDNIYVRVSNTPKEKKTNEDKTITQMILNFLSTQIIRYPLSPAFLNLLEKKQCGQLALKERAKWVTEKVLEKLIEVDVLPLVLSQCVCAYL